jgi:hypothetical protein
MSKVDQNKEHPAPKKAKHRVRYTYARGRVRVTCSCGEAQTRWMAIDTPRDQIHNTLKRAHPAAS